MCIRDRPYPGGADDAYPTAGGRADPDRGLPAAGRGQMKGKPGIGNWGCVPIHRAWPLCRTTVRSCPTLGTHPGTAGLINALTKMLVVSHEAKRSGVQKVGTALRWRSVPDYERKILER